MALYETVYWVVYPLETVPQFLPPHEVEWTKAWFLTGFETDRLTQTITRPGGGHYHLLGSVVVEDRTPYVRHVVGVYGPCPQSLWPGQVCPSLLGN